MSLTQSVILLLMSATVMTSSQDTVINFYNDGSNRCLSGNGKNNVVAFSVGAKNAFAATSTQRIPMDVEFYNDGKYFDMSANVFTAPVTGVYYFYWGSETEPGKATHTYLYVGKPNKEVNIAAAYNTNRLAHGQASGSVIKKMDKGDTASMWLHKNYYTDGYDPPSTHFNGFLVQAL